MKANQSTVDIAPVLHVYKKTRDLASDEFPGADVIGLKYGILSSPVKNSSVVPVETYANIEAASCLADRTEGLIRKLNKKDRDIEKLCTLIEAMEPIPGLDAEKLKMHLDENTDDDQILDFRDAKIVALAKKNRKLTLELQKLRSTADSRAQQIQELIKKLDSFDGAPKASPAQIMKESSRGSVNDIATVSVNVNAEELDALRRDLAVSTKSLEDIRWKNSQLTDEVKQLRRALSNEIGDAADVSQAVDGGWRGRAQQIVMLKAKVKRLETQLQSSASSVTETVGKHGGGGEGSRGRRIRGAETQIQSATDVDVKAIHELADMDYSRRQAVESALEERNQLLVARQDMETKVLGFKARIKNLEEEVAQSKQNLKVVLAAKDGDDELISSLQQENLRLKARLKDTVNDVTANRTINGVQGGIRSSSGGLLDVSEKSPSQKDGSAALRTEISRLRKLCQQQAEQLSIQDEVIRKLRAPGTNK